MSDPRVTITTLSWNRKVHTLEWLDSLGNVGTELKDIAPSLVRDFAKQARTTDAGELKDFAPAKRYTVLISVF